MQLFLHLMTEQIYVCSPIVIVIMPIYCSTDLLLRGYCKTYDEHIFNITG